MATRTAWGSRHGLRRKQTGQPTWQRNILLITLGYEAAGCLSGGALLVAAPDGRLMDMPVGMLRGAFSDFMIPGLLLLGLGILTSAAFSAVLRRTAAAWLWTYIAWGGLLIWFWVEIAILQELHWLHAMWGLPVLLGAVVAVPIIPAWPSALHRAGLWCGITSSLLYVAINTIVPLHYPGYSLLAQVPSELSAIGAPTRGLWSILSAPYSVLILAFAWGMMKSATDNRPLRVAAIAMMAYGALGVLWPFAPMHQREVLMAGGGTWEDSMHLALGAATEVFYITALIFAAKALGKAFRIYSVATFGALLIFGILTFLEAPNLSAGKPTPLIGLWERINIGLFLLWVVVLAIVLLGKEKASRRSESKQ